MTDHPVGGRTPELDDAVLQEGFDHLASVAAGPVPSVADLADRSARRLARRRARQRVVLGAAAAVLLVVGLTVALADRGDRPAVRVTTDDPTTSAPIDPPGEPAFTIGVVPDGLAVDECAVSAGPSDSDPAVVTCSLAPPSGAARPSVRITRMIDGATPEARRAFDDRDGPAAARATGTSDAPDAARFRELGGVEVLDLAPGGGPSSDGASLVRLLVGDDAIEVAGSGVPLDDLGAVLAGITVAPPPGPIADALAALPDGASVASQGARPRWVAGTGADQGSRVASPGETVGADLVVPDEGGTVTVEVSSDVDAAGLLDDLLATGTSGIEPTEVAGRPAVVVEGAAIPAWFPAVASERLVLVAVNDRTLLVVSDPEGSIARARRVAEAVAR